MATPKRLKSGNYRIQVMVNGTRKSFTAPTKAEAQMLAAQYRLNGQEHVRTSVERAINGYIELKEPHLSVSTIRNYKSYLGTYTDIAKVPISELTAPLLQGWINSLTSKGYSPKYIANVYGLLASAVRFYDPHVEFKVQLPKRHQEAYRVPTRHEVELLLSESQADNSLHVAIAMAAFGSLRRGEVCALRPEDVDADTCTINVDKAMAQSRDGQWHVKVPKTVTSTRVVRLPDRFSDALRALTSDFYDMNPNALHERFYRLSNRLRMRDITFHALRHFFATECAVNGIPQRLIEQIGGWRPGSQVLTRIYQNVRSSDSDKARNKIAQLFE